MTFRHPYRLLCFVLVVIILEALAGLGVARLVQKASAAVTVPTASTTYGFLNCNDAVYTNGVKIDGVDMTWATGSGASRKYIRAQRTADLFKNQVKASLLSTTECSTTMLQDLAKLMGSNWRYVGGDPLKHNKNGYLYDTSRWSPRTLVVTSLPGGQNRKLLQMDWSRDGVPGTNPLLRTAVTHYSSGDPEDRDAQHAKVMSVIGGKEVLLSADMNALSFPNGRVNSAEVTAPRWVMQRLGWEDFGKDVPSFTDYGKIDPGYAIDTIALSPKAQETGSIDVTWNDYVDALPTLVSDHKVLRVGVVFRTP